MIANPNKMGNNISYTQIFTDINKLNTTHFMPDSVYNLTTEPVKTSVKELITVGRTCC